MSYLVLMLVIKTTTCHSGGRGGASHVLCGGLTADQGASSCYDTVMGSGPLVAGMAVVDAWVVYWC